MISVLYNIILITNFKLIKMCIKSSSVGEGLGETFFCGGGLPCLWSRVVFTPLSIRRGGGGEAFFLFPLLPINII